LKGLDIIIQESTAEDKDKRTRSVGALREALEGLLEKAEASERPLLKGLPRKQKTLIIAIVAIFIGLVVASNIYHHYYMLHEEDVALRSLEHPSVHAPAAEKGMGSPASGERKESQAAALLPKYGSTMHLVPAGQIKFPAYVGTEGSRPTDVPAFYMDETEVTNYNYVEFLNQVLSKVEVKDGIVRGKGQPWFVLGPVYGGYEPIIFRDGRFSLQDVSAASRPVVKVTGYGASAYAAFHGERLPFETEWLRAASRKEGKVKSRDKGGPDLTRGTDNLEKEMGAWSEAFQQEAGEVDAARGKGRRGLLMDEERQDSSDSQGPSTIPYPVLTFAPNVDGIRGLTRNVSEWGVRPGLSPNAKSRFVVLGGTRGTMLTASTPFPGIAQDPSMTFEDVGFRCVKSIDEKPQ
jgi:eukaryotic-like serine/threonine-protein kinase